jgi:hypothetical protein
VRGSLNLLRFRIHSYLCTLTLVFSFKLLYIDFWHIPTLSLVNPNEINMLMTGRRRDLFRDRIIQLCDSRPVNFDLYILKEVSNSVDARTFSDTFAFKIAVIEHFLLKHKSVTQIRLWDDREKHIEQFSRRFTALKNEGKLEGFTTTLVTHAIHERKCIIDHGLERELVSKLIFRANQYRKFFNV